MYNLATNEKFSKNILGWQLSCLIHCIFSNNENSHILLKHNFPPETSLISWAIVGNVSSKFCLSLICQVSSIPHNTPVLFHVRVQCCAHLHYRYQGLCSDMHNISHQWKSVKLVHIVYPPSSTSWDSTSRTHGWN